MTDAILRLCLSVRGQPTALTLLSIYSTPIWLYISFLSCCLCLPRELPWLFQYLATYLPACLPTCLPACPACLTCLTCLSYLPTDLPTYLSVYWHLLTYAYAYVVAVYPSYSYSYPSANPTIWLRTHHIYLRPIYLPTYPLHGIYWCLASNLNTSASIPKSTQKLCRKVAFGAWRQK